MTTDSRPLGFGLPVSGAWATPLVMRHMARRAEEGGYARLWTFQRLLRPAVVDEAFVADNNPANRAVDDPSYHHVHDPLAPLAFVAGCTERIGLGVGTICAPYYAPPVLAKALATLDQLCQGRLTVGLGMGWMPQEYEATGVAYEKRGERFEEYLRCLEALWTQSPASFDGTFYSVPPAHLGIECVQRPHPPVLLGGVAPAALRRAGRLAQGWIASTRQDLADLSSSIALVREGALQAGRDPDAVQIVVRGVVDLTEAPLPVSREPLHGSADQVREDIASLYGQGATEVFVDLNFSPRVVSPGVNAKAAVAYAEQVLDALAPAASATNR